MSPRQERGYAQQEVGNTGLKLRTALVGASLVGGKKRYLNLRSNYFNSLNTETATEASP